MRWQSDVAITLVDNSTAPNPTIVSESKVEPHTGNSLLATCRGQDTSNRYAGDASTRAKRDGVALFKHTYPCRVARRVEVKMRLIEGKHGTLQVSHTI